ncbi:MAG: hypothetical protein MUE32_02950 [Bacteroidales bacterium]|jgi:hypothetical protein|nr:hypothetical protein [Bacteroidales bacterium]
MNINKIDIIKHPEGIMRRNKSAAIVLMIAIVALLAACSRQSCPNETRRDLPFIEYSFKNKR